MEQNKSSRQTEYLRSSIDSVVVSDIYVNLYELVPGEYLAPDSGRLATDG